MLMVAMLVPHGHDRLDAQSVPVVRLSAPNARLDEEFTYVGSIRELANGRVLIADEKENRLFVADFAQRQVHQIGRVGSGPGEYVARVPSEFARYDPTKPPAQPRTIGRGAAPRLSASSGLARARCTLSSPTRTISSGCSAIRGERHYLHVGYG
jgi:hypothetical protein